MTPQASGEYETKVVEAATQPTGVRAMPSRFPDLLLLFIVVHLVC